MSRLAIRLSGGYQTVVSAFVTAWPGSAVRLFAIALPRSLFAWSVSTASATGGGPQGVVVAYDSRGQVLATEPLISTIQP